MFGLYVLVEQFLGYHGSYLGLNMLIVVEFLMFMGSRFLFSGTLIVKKFLLMSVLACLTFVLEIRWICCVSG